MVAFDLSTEALERAEALGLDFAVLGPVRATESHPGATPLGWDRFSLLREGVSLPIYAIGGMKAADVACESFRVKLPKIKCLNSNLTPWNQTYKFESVKPDKTFLKKEVIKLISIKKKIKN